MSQDENLMLRNLTSEELRITSIERFERHLCRLKQIEHLDVDIRISPFSSLATDIRSPNDPRKEGLLFRLLGEKRPICIPMSRATKAIKREIISNESDEVSSDHNGDDNASNAPLSPEKSRSKFYPVYIPTEKVLAIFSAINIKSWMGGIHDDILLSALSIPGTHNSGAHNHALPTVRCQAASVRHQLKHGVRFLDIRLGIGKNKVLNVMHDKFAVTLHGQKRFRKVLDQIKAFLDESPSETIIMCIKKSHGTQFSDVDLAGILHQSYIDDRYWFTEPRIPRLGEARGKMVLIHRFKLSAELNGKWDGRGWGINATGWKDKAIHAICSGGWICVQDFYMLEDKEARKLKLGYVNDQLAHAADVRHECAHKLLGRSLDGCESDPPFYLNFLSASNFWDLQLWPKNVAKLMNPAVVDHLSRQHSSDDGDWATGIVISDWIGKGGDWTLAKCVVGMNAWLGVAKQ